MKLDLKSAFAILVSSVVLATASLANAGVASVPNPNVIKIVQPLDVSPSGQITKRNPQTGERTLLAHNPDYAGGRAGFNSDGGIVLVGDKTVAVLNPLTGATIIYSLPKSGGSTVLRIIPAPVASTLGPLSNGVRR